MPELPIDYSSIGEVEAARTPSAEDAGGSRVVMGRGRPTLVGRLLDQESENENALHAQHDDPSAVSAGQM